MNKKGNLFWGATIAIFLFIMGVLIIPFFTDDITQARIDLNCATPTSLTGGQMLICLQHDLLTPYFIWFFCSILIGYIVGGKV